MSEQGVPDLSSHGDVYEVEFGLGSNQPPTTAIIKREFQRKLLYQMSPQEVLPSFHLDYVPLLAQFVYINMVLICTRIQL